MSTTHTVIVKGMDANHNVLATDTQTFARTNAPARPTFGHASMTLNTASGWGGGAFVYAGYRDGHGSPNDFGYMTSTNRRYVNVAGTGPDDNRMNITANGDTWTPKGNNPQALHK